MSFSQESLAILQHVSGTQNISEIQLGTIKGLQALCPKSSDQIKLLLGEIQEESEKNKVWILVGYDDTESSNTLELYSKEDFNSLSDLVCKKLSSTGHFDDYGYEQEFQEVLPVWESSWGFEYAFLHPRSISLKFKSLPSDLDAIIRDQKKLETSTFDVIDEEQYKEVFLKNQLTVDLYWS